MNCNQKNPEKKFYSVGHRQFCPNMKMVRLEGVKEALETMQPEVNLDEEMRQKAALPLEKMLKLAAAVSREDGKSGFFTVPIGSSKKRNLINRKTSCLT